MSRKYGWPNTPAPTAAQGGPIYLGEAILYDNNGNEVHRIALDQLVLVPGVMLNFNIVYGPQGFAPQGPGLTP